MKRASEEGNSGSSVTYQTRVGEPLEPTTFGDTGETKDEHLPTLSNEYIEKEHSSSIRE